jgi:electron transfer flavoprotein alpha subunit
MQNVLILAQTKEGKILKSTFEILSKLKELNNESVLNIVLLGKNISNLAQEFVNLKINNVFVYDHEILANYNSEIYSEILTGLIKEINPDSIFAASNSLGKDLMPRLSAHLDSGLISECVNLSKNENVIIGTRPIYAGKALIDVKSNKTPHFFTIRPNIFEVKLEKTNSNAAITKKEITIDVNKFLTKIIDIVKGQIGKVDLTEATIIVSGGRAMKDSSNFKILDDLALVLNAAVGASRAAVDAGYAPHSMQVGQTGKVVNPSLYIACGISGAIQHLAGMRTSKVIVAINKDPEAPIFQAANYGIVGDLFTIVPLLTEAFKKLFSSN